MSALPSARGWQHIPGRGINVFSVLVFVTVWYWGPYAFGCEKSMRADLVCVDLLYVLTLPKPSLVALVL